MTTRRTLDAGAALGAGALIVSVGALVAQHAPGIAKVSDSEHGSEVAAELRVAELASAAVVVVAGGVAALLMGEWWPLLLTVGGVGATIAIYEAALAYRGTPGSLRPRF